MATRILVALAIATPLIATGCGDGGASSPPVVITSLCNASGDAQRGDASAASREYYNRAHQSLHELAALAERKDRAVAARLLEAHEAVESDLAARPAPPDLAAHLETLTSRARDALAATDQPRPGACPK